MPSPLGGVGGAPPSTSDIDRDETVAATREGGKGQQEPFARAGHMKHEARKVQSEEARSRGGTGKSSGSEGGEGSHREICI